MANCQDIDMRAYRTGKTRCYVLYDRTFVGGLSTLPPAWVLSRPPTFSSSALVLFLLPSPPYLRLAETMRIRAGPGPAGKVVRNRRCLLSSWKDSGPMDDVRWSALKLRLCAHRPSRSAPESAEEIGDSPPKPPSPSHIIFQASPDTGCSFTFIQ